jgi:hypothetical protein
MFWIDLDIHFQLLVGALVTGSNETTTTRAAAKATSNLAWLPPVHTTTPEEWGVD